MNWSIGLHIGEHLLEVSAYNGEEWKETRAFGVATALDQSLAKFLEESQISEIHKLRVVSNLPQRLFEKSHVSPCAVLTTSGFETLLELTVPVTGACYTAYPTRPRTPLEKEFVFGVSERTLNSGEVRVEIKTEELEFLAAKLEMNGIKNVAVCFLHSNVNSENERKAETVLRDKGFNVFLSSEYKAADPARFWAAILSAGVMPLFKERMDGVSAAIGEKLKGGIEVMGFGPFGSDVNAGPLANTAGALTDHLAKRYALASDLLFCGLERWILIPAGGNKVEAWHSPFGQVAGGSVETKMMEIQPLTHLVKGLISDVSWQNDAVGYDVGPMVFGRSLNPTLVDLLIDGKAWPNLAGFDDRLSERGIRRLDETLTTYAKALSDSTVAVEPKELKEELLTAAARTLSIALNKHGRSAQLTLCGPAASAVNRLLRLTPFTSNISVLGNQFFITREIIGDSV